MIVLTGLSSLRLPIVSVHFHFLFLSYLFSIYSLFLLGTNWKQYHPFQPTLIPFISQLTPAQNPHKKWKKVFWHFFP